MNERSATVLIYLEAPADGSGGTDFPRLGLTAGAYTRPPFSSTWAGSNTKPNPQTPPNAPYPPPPITLKATLKRTRYPTESA